jgi:hypothetical protein
MKQSASGLCINSKHVNIAKMSALRSTRGRVEHVGRPERLLGYRCHRRNLSCGLGYKSLHNILAMLRLTW